LNASVGIELPWQITVHYQGFPENDIIDFKNEAEVFSHFKNSVKESCFMKYGSVQPASVLSEAENQAFWLSTIESNVSKFKVFQANIDRVGKSKRNYPLRVITALRGESLFKVIRRPLSDNSDQKEVLTLADALKSVIPGVSLKSSDVDAKVVISGIEPPLDTPMKWLVDNLSHPDRFLYVVVVYNHVEGKDAELEPVEDHTEDSKSPKSRDESTLG
jgi:autophagy-related protein 5